MPSQKLCNLQRMLQSQALMTKSMHLNDAQSDDYVNSACVMQKYNVYGQLFQPAWKVDHGDTFILSAIHSHREAEGHS